MLPKLLAVLLVPLCLMIAPAWAAEPALDLLDAPVSYSADFTVSGPRGRYQGRVWHVPGRERREVATQGGGQGVLIHRDTGTAYVLGLGRKWYVGVSLEAAGSMVGGLESWRVERRRQGEETMLGQRVTRWSARATGPKGGFDGQIWTTRDGIVVKATGVVASPGGTPSPVEMALTRLTPGHVDPALLELPEGWFGLDLRQMPADRVIQAIEGMKPLLESHGGK